MTHNNLSKVVCVLALGLGAVFAGVALKVQSDPFAFTTPKKVTNVTLEAKPLMAEKQAVTMEEERVINLEPLVIKASPRKNMGAAYPKPTAKKACPPPTYQIVGFADSKFETFRGVWVYDCR